jgi:hypothetical protein
MRGRILVVTSAMAMSATTAMSDDSVHLAMSNRIGLIAYCLEQGLLADDVARAATQRVARARDLMPEGSRAAPEAARKREAAGREGRWGARGMAIETFAPTLGLTLAQFCAEQAE